MKMLKNDRIIFGSFLGLFFPFLFSLIAIAIAFYFSNEKDMPFFFTGGIATGIIVDIILMKRMLSGLFDIPFWIFAVFYILCSIFLYGIFMGLPVPELIMGIAAGFYWGRRVRIKGVVLREKENLIKKIPRFTALIMVFVCISSAFIALREKTIGEELQGMLNLSFVPGRDLIIGGIIAGGLTLILIQYFITRTVLIMTAKAGID